MAPHRLERLMSLHGTRSDCEAIRAEEHRCPSKAVRRVKLLIDLILTSILFSLRCLMTIAHWGFSC
jgi:hypothetical protein